MFKKCSILAAISLSILVSSCKKSNNINTIEEEKKDFIISSQVNFADNILADDSEIKFSKKCAVGNEIGNEVEFFIRKNEVKLEKVQLNSKCVFTFKAVKLQETKKEYTANKQISFEVNAGKLAENKNELIILNYSNGTYFHDAKITVKSRDGLITVAVNFVKLTSADASEANKIKPNKLYDTEKYDINISSLDFTALENINNLNIVLNETLDAKLPISISGSADLENNCKIVNINPTNFLDAESKFSNSTENCLSAIKSLSKLNNKIQGDWKYSNSIKYLLLRAKEENSEKTLYTVYEINTK